MHIGHHEASLTVSARLQVDLHSSHDDQHAELRTRNINNNL